MYNKIGPAGILKLIMEKYTSLCRGLLPGLRKSDLKPAGLSTLYHVAAFLRAASWSLDKFPFKQTKIDLCSYKPTQSLKGGTASAVLP
jgi:hypothetical protein